MKKRFNSINIADYRKPVKKGDLVYVFEVSRSYEAQTIYKVVHYDKEQERILVEVDPEKNFIDRKYIKGWQDSEYVYHKLKKDKLYWWISKWIIAKNPNSILKNE